MIGKSDRLDEYVWQATELGADRFAALSDPSAKQAQFEEIKRMSISDQPASARPSACRRVQLAATAVLNSRSQPPPVAAFSPTQLPQSPERQGDVFGTGVGFSCVETYSPAAVAKRGFAFDATVAGIGQRPSTIDVSGPYVPVTFTTHRWFRGGQGNQVTVAMLPPDVPTSVDNVTYAVGSRLLVSGECRRGGAPMDGPLAWACGFTRWYNQADAQSWEQAFR